MKFRDLHQTIKIRIITDFFTDITQMSILPFMAIYFSSHVGAGVAGILLMMNIIISIIVGLYSGYLSDRIGRKKMLVIAQIIQVIALTVMSIVNSPLITSVWMTYLMFIFSNVSSSLIGPAASAMIIDVSSEKERPYIYGLGYWTGNIAIALGATLGGLLFEEYKFLLFLMFLIVSIATLIIIVFFIKESLIEVDTNHNEQPIKLGIYKNYLNVLNDRGFMLFVLATVCIMSLEFQLDKYIAVRLKDQFSTTFLSFEITGIKMFSIIMLINTVTIVVATLQISKWLGRFNAKAVLTIGLAIYSVSFTTFAYSNSFLLLIIAALLFTLGELMYSPIRQTILAGIVNDKSRASYMAIDNLSYNVAMLIGSVGLTLGAWLPSSVMSILYFGLGISGLICYRKAIKVKDQQKPSDKQVLQVN
ncbi:MDR family MFS transporter [Metabacillus litoralis]|uniref:MDR family MFS transporter n=1 Tax=Metabacillus litoralis TaxID=152268 RepID=UPI001CFE26E0|nr:MFS transporter [Metabacillus litoralis]